MGFSAAHEDRRAASILPDHVTCELAVAAHSAVDLLEYVDDPCYTGIVAEIETEIDKGVSSMASTQALIERIYARSRPTGSVEYLELLESEKSLSGEEAVVAASPIGFSGVPSLTETDQAEIELDRGWTGSLSTGALIESVLERSRAVAPWPADLLERSEIEAN
jgi:hypothetical protein